MLMSATQNAAFRCTLVIRLPTLTLLLKTWDLPRWSFTRSGIN
jgi:hypothetical protein